MNKNITRTERNECIKGSYLNVSLTLNSLVRYDENIIDHFICILDG